jgi:hypothetical protein
MSTAAMLSHVVQMSLNPLDPGFHSFEKNLLPVVRERGIAIVE